MTYYLPPMYQPTNIKNNTVTRFKIKGTTCIQKCWIWRRVKVLNYIQSNFRNKSLIVVKVCEVLRVGNKYFIEPE